MSGGSDRQTIELVTGSEEALASVKRNHLREAVRLFFASSGEHGALTRDLTAPPPVIELAG
jgi:hypothetical protein